MRILMGSLEKRAYIHNNGHSKNIKNVFHEMPKYRLETLKEEAHAQFYIMRKLVKIILSVHITQARLI